jgi:poly-gamma-glutamate synthesis protein (capsule biosynthesis protein)
MESNLSISEHFATLELVKPASALDESQSSWSIVVCGDWMPTNVQAPSIQRDPLASYGPLQAPIQTADLVAFNVEGVVAASPGEPIDKDGPALAISPDCLPMLACARSGLACLANNHIGDYGLRGLASTIEQLQSAGLATVGAGLNLDQATTAYKTEIAGVRVAFINIAEGEDSQFRDGHGAAELDLLSVGDRVRALKQAGCVVVVIVHGGAEFQPVPPPHIRELYRAIATQGADLVVAHHPHVPQGFEVFHGVPIFYSLGNFLCWFEAMEVYEELRIGFALRARFRGSVMQACDLLPYRIGKERIECLTNEEKHAFWARLATSSSCLINDDAIWREWREQSLRWIQSKGLDDLTLALLNLTPPRARAAHCFRSLGESISRRGPINRLLRRFLFALARASAARSSTLGPLEGWTARHAAARLRNRFLTLSHRLRYADALGQMLSVGGEDSSRGASAFVRGLGHGGHVPPVHHSRCRGQSANWRS